MADSVLPWPPSPGGEWCGLTEVKALEGKVAGCYGNGKRMGRDWEGSGKEKTEGRRDTQEHQWFPIRQIL